MLTAVEAPLEQRPWFQTVAIPFNGGTGCPCGTEDTESRGDCREDGCVSAGSSDLRIFRHDVTLRAHLIQNLRRVFTCQGLSGSMSLLFATMGESAGGEQRYGIAGSSVKQLLGGPHARRRWPVYLGEPGETVVFGAILWAHLFWMRGDRHVDASSGTFAN